jgi:hypothetical protein
MFSQYSGYGIEFITDGKVTFPIHHYISGIVKRGKDETSKVIMQNPDLLRCTRLKINYQAI